MSTCLIQSIACSIGVLIPNLPIVYSLMPLTSYYILIRNYVPKTKKNLYTCIDLLVHNIAQYEKICSVHKIFDNTFKKLSK